MSTISNDYEQSMFDQMLLRLYKVPLFLKFVDVKVEREFGTLL